MDRLHHIFNNIPRLTSRHRNHHRLLLLGLTPPSAGAAGAGNDRAFTSTLATCGAHHKRTRVHGFLREPKRKHTLGGEKKPPKHKSSRRGASRCTGAHHAGAVAVAAVLDLGAGLVALAVAALAGCVDVDGHLLVDALCRLGERQLHHVLDEKQRRRSETRSA